MYGLCFFKQRTAYEMRISDWSSDVCSSDLNSVQRTRLGRNVFVEWGLGVSWYSFKFQEDNILMQKDELGVLFMSDEDRKSVVSGKSVSVRVDLGGRCLIKKKRNTIN